MTLPWMQPGLQLSKNPKAIGESQRASRKSRMARLERSHETSRQGLPAATKQAFVEKMPTKNGGLGQKIGDSKKKTFGKKYGKQIFTVYVYIYIYVCRILQSGVKLLPRKQKKHTKRRNRHFGAEIWHPNGSRQSFGSIYLLNPKIWVLSPWLYPWRMVPPLRNGFIGGSKHPPAVSNYPVQNVCFMMFDFPTHSVQGKA